MLREQLEVLLEENTYAAGMAYAGLSNARIRRYKGNEERQEIIMS